ncbi:hypothetical protein N7U66_19360 [Lacinutrix neustonica]|uniref:Uncharacterized protein n=1 Tax=Lacinutrix neustonica TaxID=2980107 RepID=A0A9E8SE61_9FLAO|nr:hypothetical protein [Lacinutrix neustonica]WAC01969.1 hypothetical protein N7U66_19360 [Lacinutrix neustonica]
MKDLKFPIHFSFKINTLANDFTAKDANGRTVAYVKQKLFKLKEAITIYSDENKTRVDYTIAANQWLDFSAAYAFKDAGGTNIGKVAGKGWSSIWKANYEIIDQNDKLQYRVSENNPWVKVLDSVVGEIPILGFFTGYMFHPTYNVTNLRGEAIVKLKKQPSFFGKEFKLELVKPIDNNDDERIILGLMMLILLERRRG